jgi:hypothetical protein
MASRRDRLHAYLGWNTSPSYLVWAWHMAFDGTRICRCKHSREYRMLGWNNFRSYREQEKR